MEEKIMNEALTNTIVEAIDARIAEPDVVEPVALTEAQLISQKLGIKLCEGSKAKLIDGPFTTNRKIKRRNASIMFARNKITCVIAGKTRQKAKLKPKYGYRG